MKKSLLITLCILSWFAFWLLLAFIMYIVVMTVPFHTNYTFSDYIFDDFTIMSQFVMGWMPSLLLYDEYKSSIKHIEDTQETSLV